MIESLIPLVSFVTGIVVGAVAVRVYSYRSCKSQDKPDTYVKRTEPSFKDPTKPYEVVYTRYKSRDNNLYEPVRPKSKNTRTEVEG